MSACHWPTTSVGSSLLTLFCRDVLATSSALLIEMIVNEFEEKMQTSQSNRAVGHSCSLLSCFLILLQKLNQRRATASIKLPRTLIHCAMQLATLTTGVSSGGLLSDFGFSWTPLQDPCFWSVSMLSMLYMNIYIRQSAPHFISRRSLYFSLTKTLRST